MKNYQNSFKTADQNIADNDAETVRLGCILNKKHRALLKAYLDLNIAKDTYQNKLETTAKAQRQWQKARDDYNKHQFLVKHSNIIKDKIAI